MPGKKTEKAREKNEKAREKNEKCPGKKTKKPGKKTKKPGKKMKKPGKKMKIILNIHSLLIIIGLCELHGNTNLERCKKCGKEYLRDFRVRNAKKVKAHLTGELTPVITLL